MAPTKVGGGHSARNFSEEDGISMALWCPYLCEVGAVSPPYRSGDAMAFSMEEAKSIDLCLYLRSCTPAPSIHSQEEPVRTSHNGIGVVEASSEESTRNWFIEIVPRQHATPKGLPRGD